MPLKLCVVVSGTCMLPLIIYATFYLFFFFNDTATTEIYTLSLHDALPISNHAEPRVGVDFFTSDEPGKWRRDPISLHPLVKKRSEEHTSELQSRPHLVCRLLLEKKKNQE